MMRPLKNVSRCSGIQVQGQFRRKAELDSRQAARKGDPAGLRESQHEDLALTVARKGLRRGTSCEI
jgi:transposase